MTIQLDVPVVPDGALRSERTPIKQRNPSARLGEESGPSNADGRPGQQHHAPARPRQAVGQHPPTLDNAPDLPQNPLAAVGLCSVGYVGATTLSGSPAALPRLWSCRGDHPCPTPGAGPAPM